MSNYYRTQPIRTTTRPRSAPRPKVRRGRKHSVPQTTLMPEASVDQPQHRQRTKSTCISWISLHVVIRIALLPAVFVSFLLTVYFQVINDADRQNRQQSIPQTTSTKQAKRNKPWQPPTLKTWKTVRREQDAIDQEMNALIRALGKVGGESCLLQLMNVRLLEGDAAFLFQLETWLQANGYSYALQHADRRTLRRLQLRWNNVEDSIATLLK